MTAMVTQRGGLEAFRKSWLCGDCGGSNSCEVRSCEDCGQTRGSNAPRTSQSVALSNQGNGVVHNNVLVVGGDMDNRKEYYDIPAQATQATQAAEPQYEYRMVPRAQAQNDCHCPDPEPRQLTGGERALIAGANVATWASVFVLVPAAIFFIFLIAAGIAQIARVVPL